MIDNLFIVESPLQALIAVELSLQFEGQINSVIYRLCGTGRERNDEQIIRVLNLGNWDFKESFCFEMGKIRGPLSVRNTIKTIKKNYRGKINNLFFGDFRTRWMHFARFSINPKKFILIDDGAATITTKYYYLDKKIYYPKELWKNEAFIQKIINLLIYWRFDNKTQTRRPVTFASAFLSLESEFKVDFSLVRRKLSKPKTSKTDNNKKAYYFGSKYSEAGIISRDYELKFISNVQKHYQEKGLELVYCAHRDESNEKLDLIRNMITIEILQPELPAELFVLEHEENVAEIGAAYSSVINNLKIIFPDKTITSFRLNNEAIKPINRKPIMKIYSFYKSKGVTIKEIIE